MVWGGPLKVPHTPVQQALKPLTMPLEDGHVTLRQRMQALACSADQEVPWGSRGLGGPARLPRMPPLTPARRLLPRQGRMKRARAA